MKDEDKLASTLAGMKKEVLMATLKASASMPGQNPAKSEVITTAGKKATK